MVCRPNDCNTMMENDGSLDKTDTVEEQLSCTCVCAVCVCVRACVRARVCVVCVVCACVCYLLTGEMPTGIRGFQSSGLTELQSSLLGCEGSKTEHVHVCSGSREGIEQNKSDAQPRTHSQGTHTCTHEHTNKRSLALCHIHAC